VLSTRSLGGRRLNRGVTSGGRVQPRRVFASSRRASRISLKLVVMELGQIGGRTVVKELEDVMHGSLRDGFTDVQAAKKHDVLDVDTGGSTPSSVPHARALNTLDEKIDQALI
jgi:hypothetical protein